MSPAEAALIGSEDKVEALRVVLHGRKQRSRGKNPSHCYGQERNPRQALENAREELTTRFVSPDENLLDSIHLALQLGELTEQPVICEREDGVYTITPFLRDADRLLPVRGKRHKVVSVPHNASRLHLELYALDFGDLPSIVTWLEDVAEARDFWPKHFAAKIVTEFRKQGHTADDQRGDFDEQDANEFARYVIGLALWGLQEFGCLTGTFIRETQYWRRQFSIMRPPASQEV